MVDFSQNPFIVIWEMTRSCALKCVHCRAEAIGVRSPDELNTCQAFRLLDEIRHFGRPLVVLTGGDPMRRPDAFDIVEYGSAIGLRMAMTPSGTGEMTRDIVFGLKNKGLSRLAVSLDGPTPAIHDAFRQVQGSFGWTMDILRWAREAGLSTQINTTITRHNIDQLDAIYALMEELGIALWSVFFLVPVGRGKIGDGISGREYEAVFRRLAALARTASFDIKSTEAPHFRRVLIQQNARLSRSGPETSEQGSAGGLSGPGFVYAPERQGVEDAIGRATRGVNDGNGFVFVSHTGEIYPSGFLPVSAGNVKRDSLVDVYREAPLFRRLRDRSQLGGKCGVCEYNSVCGGSRARAYAVHGDVMAPEPFCVYVPKGYAFSESERQYW